MSEPITTDKLLAEINKIIKSSFPRPPLTQTYQTTYGYRAGICTICGKKVLLRGYSNHYAHAHTPKRWKEKKLLRFIQQALEASANAAEKATKKS